MARKPKKIKIDKLLDIISGEFSKFKDPRSLPIIPLHDMLMSSFAVFSLKCPSLLSFERIMKDKTRSENLMGLYRISKLPSDTQLRDVLDEVDYRSHRKVFTKIFTEIQRSKSFEQFEFIRLNDKPYYLLAVDGTGYFRSEKIKCQHCMKYESENSDKEKVVKYGHNMLAASFVNPNLNQVISLFPEPIHNTDGQNKNDCEQNAFKRFIDKFRKEHPKLNTVILLDALYATRPVLELLDKHNIKYLIAVKNTKSLMFSLVKEGEKSGETTVVEKATTEGIKVQKRRERTYRFLNNVRLHQDKESPYVNFLDLNENLSWMGKNGKEKQSKVFAFISNIKITKDNLERLCQGGRTRWKIENETFNTLKNRGYHFEHNYGHGDKNLSYHFIMSMFLAFLVDQVQLLSCIKFKTLKKLTLGYRYLWERINAYILVLKLESWEHLYDEIINRSEQNTS